ncbi:hypothetical protein BDV96DRAFT_655756 [Lophiotrema nucula]|uniref:Aminoglycoside phosphotransferase domain-containing protein n=1 Tax=Lophiotrema nucula TaxID=690887 RepID=A0A6A5YDW7_9PLEO|nr:hypothetical protein BDV96DRAFT_655756 [Lophiotrema nucula]
MRTRAALLEKHFGTSDLEEVRALGWARKDYPAEDFVSVKFPYTAPGVTDIPTIKETLSHGVYLTREYARNAYVFKVLDKYAVKISQHEVLLQEAEDLLFLEKIPQLNTPKVFSAFVEQEPDGSRKRYCLVMEYIPGPNFREIWGELDETGKVLLGTRIGEQLKGLRSVSQETDSPFYGRVNGKGWSPWIGFLPQNQGGLAGPYSTHKELMANVAEKAERNVAYGYHNCTVIPQSTEDALANLTNGCRNCSLEDQRPVLTHLQLEPQHIILRPNDKGDYDIFIIDWEYMGWLPAWIQGVVLEHHLTWYVGDRLVDFPGQIAVYFGDPGDEDLLLDSILKGTGPINRELVGIMGKCMKEIPLDFI